MSQVVEIVKQVLAKRTSAVEGKQLIRGLLSDMKSKREKSRASCAVRLVRGLAHLEEGTIGADSWTDILGHLRQFILMYRTRVYVHEAYLTFVKEQAATFGLQIDFDGEVDADYHFPAWLSHEEKLETVFGLEERRSVKPEIGDGILYGATGYKAYASPEQKALIRASLSMIAGETMLACLPTGGGKSLVAQLPAHFLTRGGTVQGGGGQMAGTTIVIVPTVALAIDQVKGARSYFTKARSEEYKPQAYYGGLDSERKKLIIDGIVNGTIPILYTAPESVLNGQLHSAIMEAARYNRIARLVIDEAHIVVDWGGAFRTDFQLLSLFRRDLLRASGGTLRTVLLSATLTDSATYTLRKLFSEENKFTEVRCDSLRFEPMYFVNRASSETERRKRMLQIVPLLPRQLILYVTSREDADRWLEDIRSLGFCAVDAFTGDTSSKERERILKAWNNDEIDMIVATSAFGMGVDKSDIRSIVHCCIPESINRYYQEVGRGGRDGFASISLLCYVETDKDEAASINKSAVLKTETMVKRWETMRDSSKERVSGDTIWVNMGTRPSYLKDQTTGRQNANWNEVTVLFLYRHGFLDIKKIERDSETNSRKLCVQMLNLAALTDSEKLGEELEAGRERERQRFTNDFQKMIRMLREAEENCFSESFQNIYPFTSETCGGCPACYEQQQPPYYRTVDPFVERVGVSVPPEKLLKVIGKSMGGYQEMWIQEIDEDVQGTREQFHQLLEILVEARVQTIVVPNYFQENGILQMKDMPKQPILPYSLLTQEELLTYENLYNINGTIALFFPNQEAERNRLYKWSQKYKQRSKQNRIIYIASNILIASERKHLMDLVDGMSISTNILLAKKEEEFFI